MAAREIDKTINWEQAGSVLQGTPSILKNKVVLDKACVKHWEYKS